MRFPRAVTPTAKLLILLAVGGFSPITAGEAATKCPSGQILRVSLGTCVPKAQNRSFLSSHAAKKPRATRESAAAGATPRAADDVAAKAAPHAVMPLIEVAARVMAPAAEQPASAPAPQESAPLSTFGSLFVGAFRSTISMGASAFK